MDKQSIAGAKLVVPVDRTGPATRGRGLTQVRPQLLRFGAGAHPVVVVDGVTGDVGTVVDIATGLAPFGRTANYYPGLRRIIRREDEEADAYVVETLERLGPFIAGGFGFDAFDLVEASFSMVTDPPERLSPAQRAPHFDSTDPAHLAVLHYLGGTARTGTAFFRQRATSIEAVDDSNLTRFVRTAQRESPQLSGYVAGSNAFFEQIGAVQAVPDRIVIYQGALLHSGIIPPGYAFENDPRRGRLTANFFLLGRRLSSA